ncbi:MAG: ribosome biogenesis factor YjgA [Burkholderiales bacterium]
MEYEDRPSKTQRKKAMHDLQELGAQLVALNRDSLVEMALPLELSRAVQEAKRIKAREAHRRQLQYIGRLMRDVDPAPIRAKLDAWAGRSTAETALHRSAERWRDELLLKPGAINVFAAKFPDQDMQPLKKLISASTIELSLGRAPRHKREIYRIVRAMIEIKTNVIAPSEESPAGSAVLKDN